MATRGVAVLGPAARGLAARGLAALGLAAFGVTGVLGCGSDTTGPTLRSASELLWTAPFTSHAVNLALTPPYDTVRLQAVPKAQDGTVLSNIGPVQYIAVDSTVTVDATGLVTAHYRTSRTQVVARVTAQGMTLTDTVVIQVTDTAPTQPLATLSIQPRPGSGNLANPWTNFNLFGVASAKVPFYATLATGNPATDTICNAKGCLKFPLVVSYGSSDSTVAVIDQNGTVRGQRPGHVILTVSTLAYGVAKVDSLSFSVGYPNMLVSVVNADAAQTPAVPYLFSIPYQPRTLSVGGRITVQNKTGGLLEVSVPGNAVGAHILILPNPTIDTLAVNKTASIQCDSAGTYALQYRLVGVGTTVRDSVAVYNYP